MKWLPLTFAAFSVLAIPILWRVFRGHPYRALLRRSWVTLMLAYALMGLASAIEPSALYWPLILAAFTTMIAGISSSWRGIRLQNRDELERYRARRAGSSRKA